MRCQEFENPSPQDDCVGAAPPFLVLFPCVFIRCTMPPEIVSLCLGGQLHSITCSSAMVASLLGRPLCFPLMASCCWKEVKCYKGVSANGFENRRIAFIKCLIRTSSSFLQDQRGMDCNQCVEHEPPRRGNVMNFKNTSSVLNSSL